MSRYIDAELADKLLIKGYSIDEVPTADVEEVKHGKWIERPSYIRCSICGCGLFGIINADGYNYCPNCGAKMDKEKEE